MRVLVITLAILLMQGCSEEQKSPPVPRADETINPRFTDLNPRAWEGLPMSVVIADFQHSDGVFSGFICNEITNRLSRDMSGSLEALNSIDVSARTRAFNICLSSEAGDYPPGILESLDRYAKQYPQLVNELRIASE